MLKNNGCDNLAKIKLEINNFGVSGETGETIMQVAKRNGIEIPHFCMNERLGPLGACRLCIVEVAGMQKPVASCTTLIKDGMAVNTHSPKLLEARRFNLELLLANHDLNCVKCRKNLSCTLQKYASELMIQDIRFSGKKETSKQTTQAFQSGATTTNAFSASNASASATKYRQFTPSASKTGDFPQGFPRHSGKTLRKAIA